MYICFGQQPKTTTLAGTRRDLGEIQTWLLQYTPRTLLTFNSFRSFDYRADCKGNSVLYNIIILLYIIIIF
jgi:hypothetical protein